MTKRTNRARIREEKEARRYMMAVVAISGIMLLLFLIYYIMNH